MMLVAPGSEQTGKKSHEFFVVAKSKLQPEASTVALLSIFCCLYSFNSTSAPLEVPKAGQGDTMTLSASKI